MIRRLLLLIFVITVATESANAVQTYYCDSTWGGISIAGVDTVMSLFTTQGTAQNSCVFTIQAENYYDVIFLTSDSIPADSAWADSKDSIKVRVTTGKFQTSLQTRVVMVDTSGQIVDSHAFTSNQNISSSSTYYYYKLGAADSWNAGSIYWRIGVQFRMYFGGISGTSTPALGLRGGLSTLGSFPVDPLEWPPDPPAEGGGNIRYLASPQGRSYLCKPGGRDYICAP